MIPNARLPHAILEFVLVCCRRPNPTLIEPNPDGGPRPYGTSIQVRDYTQCLNSYFVFHKHTRTTIVFCYYRLVFNVLNSQNC